MEIYYAEGSQVNGDGLFYCTWACYESAAGATDCDWMEMTTIVNSILCVAEKTQEA